MKIFVIIVTYKGRRWYDACFGSLRESTIPVQVVAVDNTPGNEDAEYITEHYPEAHLIKPEENLGFGRANNLGMRYALDNGCDYVFLLNQDAWVEPDTFERLAAIHQRHTEYGLLGPVQVTAEKTKVLDGVIQFLINPDNCNKQLFGDLMLENVDEVYPVAEINAAAWLLPRKTLEVVGGFDPIFLHYGEDWNYLSRVLYHGLKVGLTPKIHVVHDCNERVQISEGYEMSFEKWLLQRATDIQYPDSIVDDMIKQYRKEAIVKWLLRHKQTYQKAKACYKYLRTHKDEIQASRTQNKKRETSWL